MEFLSKRLTPKLVRLISFGAIGGFVAAFSYAALYVQISVFGWVDWFAYPAQALASILLSFWLNHTITWRDERTVSVWRKLWKFSWSRLATIPPTQLLFMWLVAMGAHYQVANTVTIVIATAVNYAVCHMYVFSNRTAQSAMAPVE